MICVSIVKGLFFFCIGRPRPIQFLRSQGGGGQRIRQHSPDNQLSGKLKKYRKVVGSLLFGMYQYADKNLIF